MKQGTSYKDVDSPSTSLASGYKGVRRTQSWLLVELSEMASEGRSSYVRLYTHTIGSTVINNDAKMIQSSMRILFAMSLLASLKSTKPIATG